MRKSTQVILMGFIFLALGLPAQAANRYVRQGATGNGSGADWTNAYITLPAALTRGDIYYIADGTYGGYTFDDPVSGTQLITIKKATPNDHGPATDWNSTYGDGQAVFQGSGGLFSFRSHYYVIDGGKRNESNWSDGSAYGFVMAVNNPARAQIFNMTWEQPNDVWNGASNIIIKNVHAYFSDVCYSYECYLNNFVVNMNGENVSVTHSLMENISWHAGFRTAGMDGLTIEKNYFRNIYMKELISDQGGSRNVTFANNYCENVAGTGALLSDGGSDWKVLNNVFFNPDARYSFTDGVVVGNWSGHGHSNTNFKVFGNTFYKLNGGAGFYTEGGSGNEVRNNLFIGYSPGFTGYANNNNVVNAPTSIVVSAASGNFRLNTAATGVLNTGANLSAQCAATPLLCTDLEGNPRPATGAWDIGAYESPPDATIHYVRAGAPANGNGSNWTNAYPALPAFLQRGHTYYVADGNYSAYTFSDLTAGTLWITIKKAVANDHGPATDWNSSFGDGEAVFPRLVFKPDVGYIEINGQKGAGAATVPYGFRLYDPSASRNGANSLLYPDLSGTFSQTGNNSHIKLSYIDFDWGNDTPMGANGATRAIAWGTARPNDNFEIRNCYAHESSGFAFYLSAIASNLTIDGCYIDSNGGESTHHYETFWITGLDDLTFSNNVIKDTKTGALTGWLMLGDVNNAKIFNNVFTCSAAGSCARGGNGTIATWDADIWVNSNVFIYNNSFVNLPSGAIYFKHATANDHNIVAKNNLYFNSNFGMTGVDVESHNACGGQSCTGTNIQNNITSAIFQNYASGDFRLAARTNPGDSSIGALYSKDAAGVYRQNTSWDRGAFEFIQTGASDPVAPVAPANFRLKP